MASIAFDSDEASRAAKPPISVHPAFPAIVALWFSALLGVGSLVLPPALLDRFVSATGLASLLPALAPPLGFTARALLALVAALIGAMLGIAIARRVANSHAPQPESRIAKLAVGSRRPVSVRDEIGGDGVTNGQGLPLNRRRALAIAEDDRPSDFLYLAPIPGEDPYAPAPRLDELPAEDEPLELVDTLEEEPEPAADGFEQPDEEPFEEEDMPERQEFRPVSPFESFDEPEDDAEPEVEERELRKNAAGPRGMEPLPFSAPSLARRAPQPVVQVALEMKQEPQAAPPAVPVAFEPAPAPQPVPECDTQALAADWATAPVEELGLVQLVQRLGSTIEKRREWVAERAAAAPAPVPAAPPPMPLAGVEAAPAEEAAQAMAAYFGSPEPAAQAEPSQQSAPAAEDASEPVAALRPSFLSSLADDEDDEDDIPDFSLPLRRSPPASFAMPEAEEDDAEESAGEAEDAYGSLTAMRNPFDAPRSEFVRIEEPEPDPEEAPPAVVFPGQEEPVASNDAEPAAPARLFDPPGKGAPAQAAPQPADADAALRAALATLQRMSGAA